MKHIKFILIPLLLFSYALAQPWQILPGAVTQRKIANGDTTFRQTFGSYGFLNLISEGRFLDSVRNKRGVLNAVAWGLKNNNTASDSNLVKSLIARAGLEGKAILFPKGTYVLTGEIWVNNVYIVGEGMDETIIKLSPGTLTAQERRLFKAVPGSKNIRFENLTLDGNRDQQTQPTGQNYSPMPFEASKNTSDISFYRVRFRGAKGHRAPLRINAGYNTETSNNIKVIDCEFALTGRSHIELRGARNITIANCRFTDYAADISGSPAIQLQSVPNYDVKIVNNHFTNTYGVQFAIESAAIWSYNVIIDNNYLLDASNLGGNGISGYFMNSRFTNNYMEGGNGNQRSGLEIFGSNHYISGNTVTRGCAALTSGNTFGGITAMGNVQFTGNYVKTASDNTAALSVSAVRIDAGNTTTYKNIIVSNNFLDASASVGNSPGINLGRYGCCETTINDIYIKNNVIYGGATAQGIRMEAYAGSGNLYIRFNEFRGGTNPLQYRTDVWTNVWYEANIAETNSSSILYVVPTSSPFKTTSLVLTSENLIATDYGLNNSGTGSPNTYATVQAFLDVCRTNKKIAYFPGGTYLMEGGNTLNEQIIQGAGWNKTILKLTDDLSASTTERRLLRITNTSKNVEVRDMTLDGNYSGNTVRNTVPLHIEQKTANIDIANCQFTGARVRGAIMVQANFGNEVVQNMSITNCRFVNNGSMGLEIRGVRNLVISGCTFRGWGQLASSTPALQLQSIPSFDVRIVNNSFFNTVGTNYAITSDVTHSTEVIINGNHFTDSLNLGGNGIAALLKNSRISNNTFSGGNGSNKGGISVFGSNNIISGNDVARGFCVIGFGTGSGPEANNRFVNNRVATASANAAALYITGTSTAAMSNVVVSGNTLDTRLGSGNSPCINVGTQGANISIVNEIFIKNNELYASNDAQGVRLESAAGSSGIYIRGNEFLTGTNPLNYRTDTFTGIYFDTNTIKTTSSGVLYGATPTTPIIIDYGILMSPNGSQWRVNDAGVLVPN